MKILDTVFVYKLSTGEKLTHHGRYHGHGSDEFEIHVFFEGEGSFLWNKTRFPLTNNSLFLCGPHDFHSILPDRVTKAITYYAILFSLDKVHDEELYQILTANLARKEVSKNVTSTNRFLFEELVKLAASSQISTSKAAIHLLSSFLYLWFFCDTTIDNMQNQIEPLKKHEKKINQILTVMEKNCQKNIKIEDIAYKCGFSLEHFIRFFRTSMHITPHQYFIRLKAEKAAASLISTETSILQIAQTMGFENQFHFSRVFKKCTGMSPSEYRKTFSQSV